MLSGEKLRIRKEDISRKGAKFNRGEIFTAEARRTQRKENNNLCELGVSAVKIESFYDWKENSTCRR
jgi:hypothetical protein